MNLSLCLSILAILISLLHLVWSMYIGYRDVGHIKANSKIYYIEFSNYKENKTIKNPNLKIEAVNYWRRPVILTFLHTKYSNNAWGTSYIDKENGYLKENEKYEIDFKPGDSNTFSPDGEQAVELWFEDTLGRRYKVKNFKKNLKELWK